METRFIPMLQSSRASPKLYSIAHKSMWVDRQRNCLVPVVVLRNMIKTDEQERSSGTSIFDGHCLDLILKEWTVNIFLRGRGG